MHPNTDGSNSRPRMIFHMDLNYVRLKTDYLRKWLEIIARTGYDAVLWEVEDKIRWETCPECVWPEAMSKKEFSGLLDHARALGLESIPLLQTVGHAEYVLMHDRYADLRELPDRHDCYCTSNPQARRLITDWIDEYLDLFGDSNIVKPKRSTTIHEKSSNRRDRHGRAWHPEQALAPAGG